MIITSHVMNDLDEMTSEVLYLHEGKILYHKSIEELKDVTGETRLGKAIANMINSLSQVNNIHTE
jgi:Cu-processing system ATP-binding protein